jgi:hypothetical protein
VRVAVSGSHGVGKSTLIAAFLTRHPEYAHEPEAFEVLGDEVDLTESGSPTPDALRDLLAYTLSALQDHSAQACVVFERSPVDYLAYAAASGRAWPPGVREEFLAAHTPSVRATIGHLDLIAYLPLSASGPGPRRGEDERFRRRVDVWLQRFLFEDVGELLVDGRAPRVAELPRTPDHQLDALSRLVQTTGG